MTSILLPDVHVPGWRLWRQHCYLMYTCPDGGHDVNIANWCTRARMEVMTSTLLYDVHVPARRSPRQHYYMICTCWENVFTKSSSSWYEVINKVNIEVCIATCLHLFHENICHFTHHALSRSWYIKWKYLTRHTVNMFLSFLFNEQLELAQMVKWQVLEYICNATKNWYNIVKLNN